MNASETECPPHPPKPAEEDPSASYGQILKSSSILAAVQASGVLVGLLRNKCIAVFLGPSGLGLIGLYTSAIGLVGCFTGLGISQSGVREIAEAAASGNEKRIAERITILRRIIWITGIFGWLVTALLSWPLSLWCFGDTAHLGAIALLGGTLLLSTIAAGQSALIQGMRRIADLARLQIAGNVLATAAALGLYAWLGQKGIVPAFILTAVVNLSVSWWFSRRIQVLPVDLTWRVTFHEAKGMIGLGVAFMWSGLLVAAVGLIIQSLVRGQFGVEGNGHYQAAWSISGAFAGFILSAMGTDFFPRLSAASSDHPTMNRLVNEQTEIGILLALPGLVATLCFSPWMIRLLYSPEFAPASHLLPWFILGVFGRVISWPMGFVQMAMGASRYFIATETVFSVIQIALVWLCLRHFGLEGIAIAFAGLYVFYTIGMLLVTRKLSGFSWNSGVSKLLAVSIGIIAATYGVVVLLGTHDVARIAVGAILACTIGVICLNQIVRRLGSNHRLNAVLSRVLPGWRQNLH